MLTYSHYSRILFHVAEIVSSLTNYCHFHEFVCAPDEHFSLLKKGNVRDINIFVWFAKINLYRKHIFWSSWKSINTNISRIIDIFCRSSFGEWAFRLGLEICDVRRWYTGISQIAIQFFIKWNFSVKPFVYEHIQWLYQFSAPLFQKYV